MLQTNTFNLFRLINRKKMCKIFNENKNLNLKLIIVKFWLFCREKKSKHCLKNEWKTLDKSIRIHLTKYIYVLIWDVEQQLTLSVILVANMALRGLGKGGRKRVRMNNNEKQILSNRLMEIFYGNVIITFKNHLWFSRSTMARLISID